MKTANVAMKQQFKKISIDEIENLQDDMTDLLDMNNEIQEALGRSYGTPEFDESELEDGKC
jgi:charged multivesicular body protein 5